MALKVEKRDREEGLGFFQVAAKRLETPQGVRQLIVDPTRKILSWAEVFGASLSQSTKRVHNLFNNANTTLLIWFNLPRNIKDFKRSITEFSESLYSGSALQIAKKSSWVFIRSTEVAALASSGVELAYKGNLLALSSRSLSIISTLGFLGSVSLILTGIVGVYKNIKKLEGLEYMSPKYNLVFVRIITSTLLVAMGFFGMTTFALGGALFAPWIVLGVSTSFLLLSIWAHFYNEMTVKPEQKNLELKA